MNRARLRDWPVPSVVEFVQAAYQASAAYSRNSYTDTIRAVNDAARLAVQHGFRWHKDDFARLDDLFGSMRSCSGVVHLDLHEAAVKAGNDSAATAYDRWRQQVAVFAPDADGKNRRVSKGDVFLFGGERWWITAMPWEVGVPLTGLATTIRAVQYAGANYPNGHMPDARKVCRRKSFQADDVRQQSASLGVDR